MLNSLPVLMRCFLLGLVFAAQSIPVNAVELSPKLLDLNAATVQQLSDSLPGIGPAKAQRIVEWRKLNGPFPSVDHLIDVRGIGPKTLQRLRHMLRVGDAQSARRSALTIQTQEKQARLAVQQIVDQANRDAARALVQRVP